MQPAVLLSGPFNDLRRCRHGFMLYNRNDCYVGKSLELYGEFSEGEVELFRQIVRPGDIVVDAGANIGTHTLFFAQTAATHGKVFAFEPQRVVFQTLCANMALNNVTNAYCFRAGLGAKRGTIHVPAMDYSRANNFGGLSLSPDLPGESVDLLTVDALNLPACRLLKCDVEGMELQVLQGAVETIARHKPCLYVENDRLQNAKAVSEFIESLGYELYWHRPRLFHPRNFYENGENIFGSTVSLNLFCVHPTWKLVVHGSQRTSSQETHPLAPHVISIVPPGT